MFGLYNGLGGSSRFVAAYDTADEAIKDQDEIVRCVLDATPNGWTKVTDSHETVRSVYVRNAAGQSLGYVAVRAMLRNSRED